MKVDWAGLYASLLAYIVPAVPQCSAEPRATMGLCVILCPKAGLASLSPWRLIITVSVQHVPHLFVIPPPLFRLLFATLSALTHRILFTVNLKINESYYVPRPQINTSYKSSHRICRYHRTERDSWGSSLLNPECHRCHPCKQS